MRTVKPHGSLTVVEAASYLGMDRKTLRKLTQRGVLRCIRPTAGPNCRMGKQGVPTFFFQTDLDAYLNRTANTNYAHR